jgi:hypothetical protein
MMVGSCRLELQTSCVSSRRSNQLSYEPLLNETDYLKLLAELPALICTESALTKK